MLGAEHETLPDTLGALTSVGERHCLVLGELVPPRVAYSQAQPGQRAGSQGFFGVHLVPDAAGLQQHLYRGLLCFGVPLPQVIQDSRGRSASGSRRG